MYVGLRVRDSQTINCVIVAGGAVTVTPGWVDTETITSTMVFVTVTSTLLSTVNTDVASDTDVNV